MDAFTERILERARERQKKLLEYTGGEAATPLRESNVKATSTPAISKTASTPTISSSPRDSEELQKSKRKLVTSDSDLSLKPATDNVSLTSTVSEGNLPRFVRHNSKTRISSHLTGSPQLHLKTLNIHKENFNMEIKLSSTENVTIEVELKDESDTGEEKENMLTYTLDEDDSDASSEQATIREDAKKRLQRLGKLYSGGEDADIPSPIHRTEGKFFVEAATNKTYVKPKNRADAEDDSKPVKERKGLGGLAALAQHINQWEDNLSVAKRENPDPKPSTQKKSWKAPAPRPPISSVRATDNASSKSSTPRSTKPQAPKPPTEVTVKANIVAETLKSVSPTKTPTKAKSNESLEETPTQLNLDPALLKTLESQGFTRTTSNSRLVFNYDEQNYNTIKTAEITPTRMNKNINTKHCIVEESESEDTEIPIEDSGRSVSQTNLNKATHKTPQSPRKTNIKGSTVANRAAIFENASSPSKTNTNKDPALLSVSERKALFEKNKGAAPIPKAPISMATPLNAEKVAPPKNQINGTKSAKTSPVKVGKSPSTSSLNVQLKNPKQGEKLGSTHSVNVIKSPGKYPAPRPPIRPSPDTVESSAYRVAPGESGGIASKMAALFQNKSTISQQQIESSVREQRQKEMDVLLNRFHKNKQLEQDEATVYSDPESESDNETITEKTAMITVKSPQIVKKPEGIPPPPPPPPGPSGKKRRSGGRRYSKDDSSQVAAVLDEVKRIRVSNSSKPGRLYPCLSDIEAATETETEHTTATPSPNSTSFEDSYCCESDADAAETSFGRDILETVCKNQTPQKRPIFDDSTESDITDALDDMDDYIDEALAYDAADKSGPTPPKQGRSISPVNTRTAQPSNSFHYKNCSPYKGTPSKKNSSENEFKTPSKVVMSRKSDELPAFVVDGDNVLPLTHTVSFYRRQQTQGSITPVRQIVRQPAIEESPETMATSTSEDENVEVQKKIQDMLEEMTRQQTIISQTSQALNLCYSTPEFTGSTEQVEAEKVLLLATHRRSAAQREMERLSVLRTLHSENKHTENVPLEKGSVTISNMVLPLKRDYVRALNATGGKGHHVVCLIKCAEQVHCTKLVSTVATNDRNPNLELSIPGTIQLNNIYSDFTVHFEIYCLQAQEEMLPHEVKYHINSKKSHKLTPKKTKHDSRLVRPPRESPGGPQAVRSPTFALMGYVVFSIQAIKRKNWTLNNTPSMSPLEGIVEMRVKCELSMSVEHHGFLTMFQDVSGFGAWHRRWCLLKGHVLSYWKYPDEEKKKAPIDTIDLTSCITQQVSPVRRDICARPHTILLETTRPAQPHDKDSLVMECNGDSTIIRHLLAADTKEERVEWCAMFNKALTAIKMGKHSK